MFIPQVRQDNVRYHSINLVSGLRGFANFRLRIIDSEKNAIYNYGKEL